MLRYHNLRWSEVTFRDLIADNPHLHKRLENDVPSVSKPIPKGGVNFVINVAVVNTGRQVVKDAQ